MTTEHVSLHLTRAEGFLTRAQSASDPRIAQHYTELADHELAVAQARHQVLKEAQNT